MYRKLLILAVLLPGLAFASATYQLDSGDLLHDPTKPFGSVRLSKKAEQSVHYELNYLINSASRTLAVINGKTVQVGDWVSGAKVLEIGPQGVVLLVKGKKKSLRVKPVTSFKSVSGQ